MIEDYKEALKQLGRKRATSKGMTICFEDDETNKSIIEDMAIYNKLYELEDIEEELGIDLITLFKALNNPIAIRLDNGNIVTMWCSNRLYGAGIGDYFLAVDDHILHFEDYGKTWALTKEELL